MRRRLAQVLMPLLLLTAAWPAPLRAAPADEAVAQPGSEVQELMEQGIALRRAGDDARALALFERAERLDPTSARIRVHLAAAFQALGRWEQADRYLVLALEDPSDPYIVKHGAILADARRTVDAHLASLDVSGGPPGARVWLNGRSLGVLPLARPLRVAAGIYTLEVKLDGYYPAVRSVALPGGELVREQVTLTRSQPSTAVVGGTGSRPTPPPESNHPRWLPWAFAGAAALAGGGAAAALVLRERHVARYNDDSACLPVDGRTRGETCGDERRAGDRAETWMWVGTATAGAFATASVLTFWLFAPDAKAEAPEEFPTATRCGVGLASVHCSGSF